MKFLAIDTATKNCTCSLHENTDCLQTLSNQERFSHNKVLFKQIDTLLKENNCQVSDLSAIVTGLGPGSFTGLRVGVSAVKGLAYAGNIPVYGVRTPDILALHILDLIEDDYDETFSVRIFLDGKQKDFFTALYHISYKNGKLNFSQKEKVSLLKLIELETVKPAIFNFADLSEEQMKPFSEKYARAELHCNILPEAKNAGILHYHGYSKKADLAKLEPDYYKDFVINQSKKKVFNASV